MTVAVDSGWCLLMVLVPPFIITRSQAFTSRRMRASMTASVCVCELHITNVMAVQPWAGILGPHTHFRDEYLCQMLAIHDLT